MKQEVGFFESFDRQKLYFRNWISSHAKPKACLIIHGFGEHSGRYDELVRYLADSAYSFFSFDLRGQGQSGGKRVDLRSFSDFIQDGESFLDFLYEKKMLHTEKITLLGHSLGGLISIELAEKLSEKVNKLVLSSPFLGTQGLAALNVTYRLSSFLNCVAPNMYLPGPARPGNLFHDPGQLKEYLADRLIERRITARFAYKLLTESRRVSQLPMNLAARVLVLASGSDRIVSLEKTRSWFDKLSATQKKIKVFPGFYHEIFHETGRKEPMQDVKQFLEMPDGGAHEDNL